MFPQTLELVVWLVKSHKMLCFVTTSEKQRFLRFRQRTAVTVRETMVEVLDEFVEKESGDSA